MFLLAEHLASVCGCLSVTAKETVVSPCGSSLSLNLGRKRDAVWLVLTGVQVVFAPLVKHHCQSHRMYRLVWNILIFLILVKFWRLTDVCLSVWLKQHGAADLHNKSLPSLSLQIKPKKPSHSGLSSCLQVYQHNSLARVFFLFFFFSNLLGLESWTLS